MAEDTFNPSQEPDFSNLDSFVSNFGSGNTSSQTPSPKKGGDSFFNDMDASLSASINKHFNVKEDRQGRVGPSSVSFATPDVDKYVAQSSFDGFLFNPDDPENNARFAERETWGSAMGKAFDDFAYKFGNTHNEGWKMYGRFASAALNGSMSELALSETELIENFYADQENAAKNHVFMDPKYDDDIFSKRSMAEFIGNAGFALGTFAQFAEELVIDAALTFITAPAGGEGAASFGLSFGKLGATLTAKAAAKKAAKEGAGEVAEQIAKKGNFFGDILKGANMSNTMGVDDIARLTAEKSAQATQVANAARRASPFKEVMSEYFRIISFNVGGIAKSKTLTDLGLNVAKGMPLLGTAIKQGEKVAAGAAAGMSTGVLTGMGLMGARRVAQELSMSLTEANFETVGSYGDTLEIMLDRYREENSGEAPPAEEFEKMRSLALSAASSNLKTNTGILLVTNKIQFGSLFNKFLPSNKLVGELLQEQGQNILKVQTKGLTKEFNKGFFGTYGLLGQVAKDFGKKQAAYEFGKQFLKGTARFEILEGIQENMQETSNVAWRDYYAGQYNATEYTLSKAFEKGLAEQFTKQGFKTFLQGALTGSLIKGPTKVVSHLAEKMQESASKAQYASDPESNPSVIAKKQIEEGINLRNDLYMQMSKKKFTQKNFNFNAQVSSAVEQTEAAGKNSKHEWVNANENAVLAGAISANQAGSIGAYVQAIKNMGKTSTVEEFEEMTGVKLEDTKYTSPQEWADEIAREVETYSKTVDDIRNKFKNMVDPSVYAVGSKDRIYASHMRHAQEEAVRIIALNAIKASNASERAQKVSQQLSEIPGMSSSSEYAVRVLTNAESLIAEKGNVAAELKILEESLSTEGLDSDTKKQTEELIKDKKEELDLFSKWESFWSTRAEVLGAEGSKPSVEHVFVGKKIGKSDVKDVDGTVIEKDQDVYNEKDQEVIDTFRKLLNLKNKQGGLNTEVSEEAVSEGIEKIVDFIKLDRNAKDYMDSVNSLMNPSSYNTTLSRMMDGNFKATILEVVDNVKDRVLDTVIDIIKLTGDLSLMDPAVFQKTAKEVEDALMNSEGYKKLLAISVDPNMGVQNSKYAMDAMEEFDRVLKTKLVELVSKHGPDVAYNDILDNDFAEFEKDNANIHFLYKESIAKKLAAGETLTSKQQSVYTAHKEEIDNLKQNYKTEEVVEEEKEEEVNTSTEEAVFKNSDEKLLEAYYSQLAVEESLVEGRSDARIEQIQEQIDELERKISEEAVTNAEYNEYLQGNLSPEILEGIADKVKNQIPLSERELEIATTFQNEIKEMNNPVQQSSETTTATTSQDTTEEESAETEEDEPGFSINQLFGVEEESTEEKTEFKTEPSEEEGGYNVTDEKGTVVNNDPISKTEAETLSESLNASLENINHVIKMLNERGAELSSADKAKLINRLQNSMSIHNKTYNTEFKSLEEYYDTALGREKMNDIVEGMLTGRTAAEVKKERKRLELENKQENTIGTETTTAESSPVVDNAVQSMYERLQTLKNEQSTEEVQSETQTLEEIEAELAAIEQELAEEIVKEAAEPVKKTRRSRKKNKSNVKPAVQTVIEFPEESSEKIPDEVITQAVEETIEEIQEVATAEPIQVSETVEITEPEEVVPVVVEAIKETVPVLIEESVEEAELEEVAAENDIAKEEAVEFVTEAVAEVVSGEKNISSFKPKTKSLLKKLLAFILSAGLLFGMYISTVGSSTWNSSKNVNTEQKIQDVKEVVFSSTEFQVTKLEGCTEYVLNQVRSVIGKDGQEKLNMHGDAWTLGTITEKTGYSDYIYRTLPVEKPTLKTADEVTNFIKESIQKAPKLNISQLKPGDLVNLFYEGSSHTYEAYELGGNVFTSHLGIIKLDSNGQMILEHNTGGTIHKDNLQDAIDGKLKSVKGSMMISGVFRMKYEKLGVTPSTTIKTAEESNTRKQELLDKKKELTAKLQTIKAEKVEEKSEKNAKFVEKDNLMASVEKDLKDITSCL